MSYRRGAAVLSSDSASTLAIVKELISKEATSRRVHITDSFQVRSCAVLGSLYQVLPFPLLWALSTFVTVDDGGSYGQWNAFLEAKSMQDHPDRKWYQVQVSVLEPPVTRALEEEARAVS